MKRDTDQSDAQLGRREFLQLVGFGVSGAALGGCSRSPAQGVMPYLIRPEEVTPGRAYWYATVCGACPAACGVLAKDRDGRPIKLEGNPDHPVSRGGLCAVGQASVLSLYDSRRLRAPLRSGQPADWPQVDAAIRARLAELAAGGGRVRVLTDSTTGPAESAQIESFLAPFRDGRHVVYDPISSSALADAHQDTYGVRMVPRYRFERARVILSFGADFLSTWIAPVEHAHDYRAGRELGDGGKRFSRHIQLESRLSLTGSNADRRVAVPPGASPLILAHLTEHLARASGASVPWSELPAAPVDARLIEELATELRGAARGATLVVCGDNDSAAQRLTSYLNHLLGNDAGDAPTVNLAGAVYRRGDDGALRELIAELEAGQVAALFVRGVNPAYDLAEGPRLAQALGRSQLVVSFAEHQDETALMAHFVCPEPHQLESWGDSEPRAGVVAIRQPALRPMGSSRPFLESLATWAGQPASARELVRAAWRSRVHPRADSLVSFDAFWNRTLHDGYARVRAASEPPDASRFELAKLTPPKPWSPPGAGELAVEVHASAGLSDGRHAHNPWLQELPDPVTKTVWDNFAGLAPATAERLGVTTGDVIELSDADGTVCELPALVQPGQHEQGVAIALGYGRVGTDRFTTVGPQWWEARATVAPGHRVGTNAAPLLGWSDESISYTARRMRVRRTGRRHELARTQLYHSLDMPESVVGHHEHRAIVQEASLVAWQADPSAGSHGHHELPSLYEDHPKAPHHWGMAIDLSACNGCSACVVACQAENNIPVVGKDEVGRGRDMAWMRIDRYYQNEATELEVAHMPMMCQHCDNAPCENVCPVQATVQSAEGLNQQVYNRCVGTRYCANNCPYKVRRFNWFTYPKGDRLENLALNPDVTVRTRGVMEKCSLCVQRIQDAKAEAKRAGRPLSDGDIQPACAQSCPAGAIVFGDMNDPESAVSRAKQDPRHFVALEELGVRPVVGYLTKIRNREEA